MMKSFTPYRFCNWRFVRYTLLWTVFILCVYWYSETTRPQQQKLSRHIQPDNDRKKLYQVPETDILNPIFKSTDSLLVNLPEDNNKFEEQESSNDTRRNKQHDGNTNNKLLSIKEKRNKPIFDDKRFYDTEKKGKELEESEEDYSDTKNDRFLNSRDDVADANNTTEYSGNTHINTLQSALLISALRARVANPQVLRSGRLHWTIAHAGTYSEKLFSPPPKEIPEQRLPQAIIIGFGKCGTRALIDFMSIHPNIVTTGPEVHFFDVDENFNKGLGWYKDQMPLSYSNQMTVEKTPSYIWSERALEEIYKLNKHMKLIVIMKDPVSRIVSQALRSIKDTENVYMVIKDGHLQVNNQSRTVQWSMYAKYLKLWMKKFPKSQIHVLESNEFASQPAKELRKIEAFLGVAHMITEDNFYFNVTKGFFCKRPLHLNEISCLPEGKGMPHPELNPIVEKKMYDFFRGYNEDLFLLLGRKFQWEPPAKPSVNFVTPITVT